MNIAPPQNEELVAPLFGARGIVLPLPPLVTPVEVTQKLHEET